MNRETQRNVRDNHHHQTNPQNGNHAIRGEGNMDIDTDISTDNIDGLVEMIFPVNHKKHKLGIIDFDATCVIRVGALIYVTTAFSDKKTREIMRDCTAETIIWDASDFTHNRTLDLKKQAFRENKVIMLLSPNDIYEASWHCDLHISLYRDKDWKPMVEYRKVRNGPVPKSHAIG